MYDEVNGLFRSFDDIKLELEHSLVSVSKWESKFEKPFLSKEEKTAEEIVWYVDAMVLAPEYPRDVLTRLTAANIATVNAYIEAKMSATTFGEMPKPRGRTKPETITSELIYYWMIAFQIPFECERWHLNRLFSLIRICNVKQGKPEKMSKAEMARRNRELNESRKKQFGTNG